MLHELQHTGNDNKTSEVNVNAQFTWNFLPYLNITVTPAYSQGTNDSQLWADAQSWNVALLRGCDYNATLPEEVQNLMEGTNQLPENVGKRDFPFDNRDTRYRNPEK